MNRDRRVGFTSGETIAAVVGDFSTVQWVLPTGGQINGWHSTAGFIYWWLWPERGEVFFDAGLADDHSEFAFATGPTSGYYRSGHANQTIAGNDNTLLMSTVDRPAGNLNVEISPGGSVFFQNGLANTSMQIQVWGWEFSNENIRQATMPT